MNFLKNTLLVGEKYTRTDETGTLITVLEDYSSLNLPNLYEFINQCDKSWFSYIGIGFNDKLERIAHEIYGNAHYWDIIMIINEKSPFDCLPYDDDTIKKMANNKVERYINITGNLLPVNSYKRLYNKYLKEIEDENEDRYILKIIKPAFIQEFLQQGYERDAF